MRCPACSRMRSFGDAIVELQESALDDEIDGRFLHVSATVRMVLPCEECGEELKEGTFELEADHDYDELGKRPWEDHKPDCVGVAAWLNSDEEILYAIEFDEPEATERQEHSIPDPKKPGKMKNVSRFPRRYRGVSVSYNITCSSCGSTVMDGTLKDDMQASYFEEIA